MQRYESGETRLGSGGTRGGERDFFIDSLLVRIHFIIVMIRWTGLAPWEFEFPFPGSLTSTFLQQVQQHESGETRLDSGGTRGEDLRCGRVERPVFPSSTWALIPPPPIHMGTHTTSPIHMGTHTFPPAP